jgi:hypothetical protein
LKRNALPPDVECVMSHNHGYQTVDPLKPGVALIAVESKTHNHG